MFAPQLSNLLWLRAQIGFKGYRLKQGLLASWFGKDGLRQLFKVFKYYHLF
jgi:hypothetical protein